MEVVQDVLITVCTNKDKYEKKDKMKQCVQKIVKNKEDAAKMHQN